MACGLRRWMRVATSEKGPEVWERRQLPLWHHFKNEHRNRCIQL